MSDFRNIKDAQGFNTIEGDAKEMAEAINGGNWDEDYTDAQKKGWRMKIKWAMQKYLVWQA